MLLIETSEIHMTIPTTNPKILDYSNNYLLVQCYYQGTNWLQLYSIIKYLELVRVLQTSQPISTIMFYDQYQ